MDNKIILPISSSTTYNLSIGKDLLIVPQFKT